MSGEQMLAWVVRWLHIASAILALGAPFFVRVALMPAAAKALDEESHRKLRAAINARWKYVVHTLITLFIVTGLYTFLVTARWKSLTPDEQRIYHMIFGIKMLGALAVFTIASGLVGRSGMFAPLRKNARLSVTLLLVSGAIVLACATWLRMMPWGAAGH